MLTLKYNIFNHFKSPKWGLACRNLLIPEVLENYREIPEEIFSCQIFIARHKEYDHNNAMWVSLNVLFGFLLLLPPPIILCRSTGGIWSDQMWTKYQGKVDVNSWNCILQGHPTAAFSEIEGTRSGLLWVFLIKLFLHSATHWHWMAELLCGTFDTINMRQARARFSIHSPGWWWWCCWLINRGSSSELVMSWLDSNGCNYNPH